MDDLAGLRGGGNREVCGKEIRQHHPPRATVEIARLPVDAVGVLIHAVPQHVGDRGTDFDRVLAVRGLGRKGETIRGGVDARDG
jgi:hypothetical protein